MKNTLFFLSIVLMFTSCQVLKKDNSMQKVGQIITPQGEILFSLHKETPKHAASFIELATKKYWNNYTFNRVIPGFVAQCGCPDTKEGFSDSPYLIHPEFNDKLKHTYGAVGVGRDNNPEKLSAGCQLYIVLAKEGLPRLDGDYTIFGQVFKGFDVMEKIEAVKTDSTDTPLIDITMKINVIEMSLKEMLKKGFSK